MDTQLLRILLLIAGVALVVGIYLADRMRRRRGRRSAAWVEPVERVEPRLDDEPAAPSLQREPAAQSDLEITPPPLVAERETPSADEVRILIEPDPPAADAPELIADLPEDAPELIVQINVAARGVWFDGPALAAAAGETGLVLGPLQIFERRLSGGQILFSLANMVEPGVFPKEGLDGFSCPGVALFARLPAAKDGLAVFSDMLFTAERFAALLNGELQDQRHNKLTRQAIEALRSEILEHRRRLQLARKAAYDRAGR